MIIPSMLIGAFFYMMIVSQMTKTISMFRMGDIRYTEKVGIYRRRGKRLFEIIKLGCHATPCFAMPNAYLIAGI